MSYMKTQEQELLLDSLKELVGRHINEAEMKRWYKEGKMSGTFPKAFLDAGFGFLGMPEEYGGTPTDVTTLMLVAEETTRLAGGYVPSLINILTMYDIIKFGRPDQIKAAMDIYEKEGQSAISLCISEPGAGSDNSSMATYVKEVNGKLILNGSKTFVTAAQESPFVLVIAKDNSPDVKNKEFSLWMFPTKTKGVKVNTLEKIGQKSATFCEVFFDDVEIDESCLVGKRGHGFIHLMENFEVERLIVCAIGLGFAQAAMDDAVKYAAERQQFGTSISNFQLVQEMLTDMEIKLEVSRAYFYKTCWELDNNISVRLSSALCKRFIPKACVEVCDMAVQIFGGIGYTTETRVARLWQDVRGYQIGGGTDQIMVHIAGRQIIKKYVK